MTRIWTDGFDNIVEIFDRYRAADKRIRRLAEQLDSISIKTTAAYTDQPRSPSDVPELQRYVECKERVRDAMRGQLEAIADKFDLVVRLTGKLQGIEHQVVMLYYIVGHPMHRVAQDLNHSVRQCWRIRDDAFYRLAEDGTPCHTDS